MYYYGYNGGYANGNGMYYITILDIITMDMDMVRL